MKQVYNSLAGVLVVAILCAIPAQSASAVTYYTTYPQQQTNQELINSIYALLAQMQYTQPITVQPTVNAVVVNPNGSVLGAATSNTYSRVDVFTEEAVVVDYDEARLYGELELNNAAYATVWFEYGLTQGFGNVTNSGRITSRREKVFLAEVTRLAPNARYYYRAVARDDFGALTYGRTLMFDLRDDYYYDDDDYYYSNDRYDDEPDVDTNSARDIDDDSAELRGEVDMNDYNDGLVFFVYGEDRNDVEDVEDEDEYDDVRERGDDLQKLIVDHSFDGSNGDFYADIYGLDDDTKYYFRICVEYEDDDRDETLECGDVEDFYTDRY